MEGKAGDVGYWVFVGVGVFGDVGGMDGEPKAGLGEELAAAGGGGGENEGHSSIIADAVGRGVSTLVCEPAGGRSEEGPQ